MLNLSPLFLSGRVLLDAARILQAGLADRRASFELSIGKLPPHTGFAVVAGVETLLELLSLPLVNVDDLAELQRIVGISEAFIQRLARFSLRIDIDAVPDGTIVFARTPLASVEGPFLEAALISAMVRDTVARSTLIATRAARLHVAAGGEPVIDGSSERAPSPSGSLTLARAAHIGGASATTNPLAAAQLEIPFREAGSLDLGVIAAPGRGDDVWGGSPVDMLVDLGAGDDEEAVLIEAKRIGARSGGWIARGLCDGDASVLGMRYELVALEEDGVWAPRRGARGDVLPGRKRIARYIDAAGHAMADVVHLQNERMQSPRTVGAATLVPLALTVMRAGRLIAVPEPPSAGRERAVAAQGTLESGVKQLCRPEVYRVDQSPAVTALRESLDQKAKPPARSP
jgi:nicotinate phosphoribosyltransferase